MNTDIRINEHITSINFDWDVKMILLLEIIRNRRNSNVSETIGPQVYQSYFDCWRSGCVLPHSGSIYAEKNDCPLQLLLYRQQNDVMQTILRMTIWLLQWGPCLNLWLHSICFSSNRMILFEYPCGIRSSGERVKVSNRYFFGEGKYTENPYGWWWIFGMGGIDDRRYWGK